MAKSCGPWEGHGEYSDVDPQNIGQVQVGLLRRAWIASPREAVGHLPGIAVVDMWLQCQSIGYTNVQALDECICLVLDADVHLSASC